MVDMAIVNCLTLSSSSYISSLRPLTSRLPVSEVQYIAIPSGFRAQFLTSRDDYNVVSRREAIVQQVTTSVGFLVSGRVASAAELKESETVAKEERPKFYELDGSGGVKALDIREGNGASPQIGDKVVIHYYARLAAKQGWRFDSTYDHKDQSGAPEPYVFIVGSGDVISGLDAAVRSMKEGEFAVWSYLHHKDIRIQLRDRSLPIISIDRDFTQQYSIPQDLPMERALLWGP